jgi:S1/P1 Nuclease
MNYLLRLLLVLAAMTFAKPGWSWDPHGHALVGSVADQLLTENARKQVRDILGFSLQSAAKWPDCVRSVERKPDGSFHYNRNTPYQAPCDDFMAPAEVARMEDYARRNWDNCAHRPGHGCHEAYHFADVPIQRGAYSRSFFGTNDHDVVSALTAAIDVLEGKKPPTTFSIKDKKEALFLLAHFAGDIHQPLHVGSVYLDANGSLVDPSATMVGVEQTETQGGNLILLEGKNLHGDWDEVPETWTIEAMPGLLSSAKGVPATTVQTGILPALWGSETVRLAGDAFRDLKFGPKHGTRWTAVPTNAATYKAEQDRLKKEQIAKAGARLAAVLNTIWP